jgi:hypothetical protein
MFVNESYTNGGFENYAKHMLNWESFDLLRPNYINYLCPVGFDTNEFVVCADNSIYVFEIADEG